MASLIAVTAAGLVHAANDEPFFLSNEAALTGGAVTATARDPGALWYNPAGLGAVERNRLDLQATVLAFDQRTVRDGIVVRNASGEQREDVDAGGFQTLSPSIVFTRRIKPGLTGGLGIFTTKSEGFNLAGGAIDRSEPQPDSAVRIEIDAARTRYHIGPGIGWQARPGVRFGASLFVVYDQERNNAKFALLASDARTDPVTAISATLDLKDDATRLGAQANLGLQWQPSGRLHVGVSLWTPLHQFRETVDSPLLSTTSVAGPGIPPVSDLTFQPESRPPTGAGTFEPGRVTVGVGRDLAKGRIAIETSYSPSLQSFRVGTDTDGRPTYVTDRSSVWNVRIGGLVELRENLEFGAGFFTDRSSVNETVQFPEFDVDYYGLSAGIRSLDPIRIAEGQAAGTLVFEWALAVRYSYGTGQAGEAVFNLVDGEFVSTRSVDVHFQQLYLHIGTGLRF